MATSVLIVDDHPSFRAGVRMLLECEGYDVVGEAGDGASALAATSTLAPDLVLLDIQLPDMTGFDVAARVAAAPHAPAVILTSSRDWSDFDDLVDGCGARGFVAKDDLSGEALARLLA